MKKDLISIKDLECREIEEIFAEAAKMKAHPSGNQNRLKGRSLGLIFQKPSNRTRVSFEVGIYQLGGFPVYLGPDDIKLGIRESTKDIARTLSRYLDCIIARTFAHRDITELADNAAIPVINALSDLFHPCQAMADIFTIRERFNRLEGVRVAFIGDGNNVLHSLLCGAARTGLRVSVTTPKGYGPKEEILEEAKGMCERTHGQIEVIDDKFEAVRDADVIYTDVWTSMGHEQEAERRLKDFAGFQIDGALLEESKSGCIVMHCLPAHRGEEITGDVIDGPNSAVFEQAENRLHVQKAILLKLLG